jgi:hypothetical protein
MKTSKRVESSCFSEAELGMEKCAGPAFSHCNSFSTIWFFPPLGMCFGKIKVGI